MLPRRSPALSAVPLRNSGERTRPRDHELSFLFHYCPDRILVGRSGRLAIAQTFDTILGVSISTAAVASSPKLLDRVRWHLRVKHYSVRTEQAYVDWIRRYILFHRKRHSNEMGEKEITEFLTHLAVKKHVAASTQN